MRNLHTIESRPVPDAAWLQNPLRQGLGDGSGQLFPVPAREGEEWPRAEFIAQRLGRRVAELRARLRYLDGIALVLTRAEYDAFRHWLVESPAYRYSVARGFGPDMFEGVPLVVR